MAGPSNFPGFSSPAAGPEAPLEMLAACHERMQRQCDTLQRLVAYLPRHGSDAQACEASQAVMRYFDRAAPQHHADEETDLFPALLESMAGSDALCIRAMSERVSNEHRQLETLWQRLRPDLERVSVGEPTTLPAGTVEAFVTLCRAHLAYEETELFPMAARLLADDELARIGQAMGIRRGLPG
jgi:hemerythrin-like domain-containing protein